MHRADGWALQLRGRGVLLPLVWMSPLLPWQAVLPPVLCQSHRPCLLPHPHSMACLSRLPSWVRRIPSTHVTAPVCHEPCTARGQRSTTQRCSAQAWTPRPAAIPRGHRVRRCCRPGPCGGPGQWSASPKGTPWAVPRQCRPRASCRGGLVAVVTLELDACDNAMQSTTQSQGSTDWG